MRRCLSDGFNFFLNLSPNSLFHLILLIFSWFEMQPHTHSSSGISRPKKRDPKNVADPPVPPHKSETQKEVRWHPRPGRHTTQRSLQLPWHPKVFSTVLLHHPVTDVISDLCSGPSTSCKWVATAPISPQDRYKHARHEQDKEEEEKDEEDEENDEDEEDEEDNEDNEDEVDKEVDEDAQGELDKDPTKSEFSEFLI